MGDFMDHWNHPNMQFLIEPTAKQALANDVNALIAAWGSN
ncbi:hypothetical protein [Paenibacillus sp. MBLB4367]